MYTSEMDVFCGIAKRVIRKDCCFIEAGTIIAADMVILPFSRGKGRRAKIIEEGGLDAREFCFHISNICGRLRWRIKVKMGQRVFFLDGTSFALVLLQEV